MLDERAQVALPFTSNVVAIVKPHGVPPPLRAIVTDGSDLVARSVSMGPLYHIISPEKSLYIFYHKKSGRGKPLAMKSERERGARCSYAVQSTLTTTGK